MAKGNNRSDIYDPRKGDPAIRVQSLRLDGKPPSEPARTNCYAIYMIEFAYGLGAVIVLYGLLLCLDPWLPQAAAVGSFLVFVMSSSRFRFSSRRRKAGFRLSAMPSTVFLT
jgi:uncharacterized membrane protein YkgB